jgi:hypothetical protein
VVKKSLISSKLAARQGLPFSGWIAGPQFRQSQVVETTDPTRILAPKRITGPAGARWIDRESLERGVGASGQRLPACKTSLQPIAGRRRWERILHLEFVMSSHMPPVPPANRSAKGPRGGSPTTRDTTLEKNGEPANAAEQGETANIKQNTTNAGFFHGRRVK